MPTPLAHVTCDVISCTTTSHVLEKGANYVQERLCTTTW